jgi:hypothetical protein
VPVPTQESERSCISVLGYRFSLLFCFTEIGRIVYKHFSYILGPENKLQLKNLLKPNNKIFAYQDHTYYPNQFEYSYRQCFLIT